MYGGHMLRDAWSPQKLEGRIPTLDALWREHSPADALILDFWPPEHIENTFLLFSYSA